MSDDFDVVTGPAAPPPKIKPAALPAPDARQTVDRDKMATLPKEPEGANDLEIVVVPAKAGTQENRTSVALDSRLRGNDGSFFRAD